MVTHIGWYSNRLHLKEAVFQMRNLGIPRRSVRFLDADRRSDYLSVCPENYQHFGAIPKVSKTGREFL